MITSKDPIPLRTLVTEMFSSLFFSIILFTLFMFIINFMNIKIVWDIDMILSIIGSVVGVAYVLTIKNPVNFLGFFFGITMSLFLALQCFLIKSYDQFIIYLFIFIPIQINSIINWKKSWNNVRADLADYNYFKPKFLNLKKMLLAIASFIFIILIDSLIIKYIVKSTFPLTEIIISAIMVSSSIIANFLLIFKKIDSWIYWIIYSISGIVFAVQIDNKFNLLLFIFFLLINSYTAFKWIKMK